MLDRICSILWENESLETKQRKSDLDEHRDQHTTQRSSDGIVRQRRRSERATRLPTKLRSGEYDVSKNFDFE